MGGGSALSELNPSQNSERMADECSVWHPLQGPLVDWPLALCDGSTVDFENDTMAGDIVDKDAVFENTQVHFNPEQRWYYLSDQTPEELLIFKNADSEEESGGMPGEFVSIVYFFFLFERLLFVCSLPVWLTKYTRCTARIF